MSTARCATSSRPRSGWCAHPRFTALLRQFDAVGNDFPKFVDVTWSRTQQAGQEPEQCLRGECRHAWRCLNLGVAYYWRGIGAKYSAEVFTRLQAVAIFLKISDFVPA
jgi:hypothetical protein